MLRNKTVVEVPEIFDIAALHECESLEIRYHVMEAMQLGNLCTEVLQSTVICSLYSLIAVPLSDCLILNQVMQKSLVFTWTTSDCSHASNPMHNYIT